MIKYVACGEVRSFPQYLEFPKTTLWDREIWRSHNGHNATRLVYMHSHVECSSFQYETLNTHYL